MKLSSSWKVLFHVIKKINFPEGLQDCKEYKYLDAYKRLIFQNNLQIEL